MDMAVDISNVFIETEHLILRGWESSDLEDFFEYASVAGVGELAGWLHHDSKGVSQKILETFITEKNVFAVVFKSTGKVIGSLGLHRSWVNDEEEYSNLKSKEVGYVLSKDYWGNGLIPEAVTAVISFCFDNYALDAITCGHFSNNNQSKRVIEKCGFEFVSRGTYYSKQMQKEFEVMRYILLSPRKQRAELSPTSI